MRKKDQTKKQKPKTKSFLKKKSKKQIVLIPFSPASVKTSLTHILYTKTSTSSLMLTPSHLRSFYFIRGKGNFISEFVKCKQQAPVKCFSNVLLLI